MRKRIEDAALKNWDECDTALKAIAEAEHQITILESSMNQCHLVNFKRSNEIPRIYTFRGLI